MQYQHSLTTDLAAFCATLRAEHLPSPVRERVRYLLLDHLAVTLRGSLLPSSQAAYKMVSAMQMGTARRGTIFGRLEGAEATWVAFANGVAAHGLEMDDVENRSSLHPGVVVFPAALALSEQLGSSPADFYAAVVAGYEVTLRVGAALNPASAYERGFHPTAVCGTFGAAAASARLLGLTPEETNMALGIAGSMAAGSMSYLHDGAWTKRLHPGWASHAGITAARLAAAGFVGPTAIFESPYGFLHAYSSQSDMTQLVRPPNNTYAIMDVSIKPYACCRYMHGPIDCLLHIRREHQPDPQRITHVRCGVLTGGRGLIADPIEQKRLPENVVDAQFSMPFGAAIALLTGQAGLSVFSETWLHNPEVRALMQKVAYYSSPDLDNYYPAEWRASAEIQMDDGQIYCADVRYPLGDPYNSLSWEQLEARFTELVTPVIPDEEKRQAIIARVKGLDNVERMEWDSETLP
ncbi:MAG TPA: MmgE/PrpD family protein [Ktedonobacteraceae bacterium]|nr:MmgE/PrpD family protein [Ktedonobacteraceae bacterium]